MTLVAESTTQEQPQMEDCSMPKVKLIVGPEEHTFYIHESFICSEYPFSSNSFSGNFQEAETKVVTFPDDDPERFKELYVWLYGDITDGTRSIPNSSLSWIALSIIWLFADKYHIDELQNTVIDSLHAKFAAHEEGINISFEALEFVAENTFPRSPLRRIFADMLTNGVSLQRLPKVMDQIPNEFLQDICLALKTTISLNGPTNISLLTNPISTYYTSSDHFKSTAMPPPPPSRTEAPSHIYCKGDGCPSKGLQPIRGLLHIGTKHNITLCHACRHQHYGRHKNMVSLTTAPYHDAITGRSTIVDGHIEDSSFCCDGPKCDPENRL